MTPKPLWQSEYSLPSTSHTRLPLARSKKIGYGGESWKLEATPRGSEASDRSRHSRDLGVRSWTSWVRSLVSWSIRSWSGRRPMLITLLMRRYLRLTSSLGYTTSKLVSSQRILEVVRMPRTAGVDAVDRRIVAALQRDGRRPFTSIGRELGISEAAVRQRVARLQAAGIMQVVAVADPMALGYQAMAMVGISVDGRARKQVAEAVGRLPEVSYLVL